jgi:Rps23 Pro-64 3,4-dihydroxylase Tpa1-like proline 4-hydroxylase
MINDWVSKRYLDEKLNIKLRNDFTGSKPFSNLVLDGFFDNFQLKNVFQALLKEQFERKEADLFDLCQTQDFETSESEVLQEFRTALKSKEFISFMESITGLKLKAGKISIAGSLYEDGDYLLCHDDQLEGRKIAFLIYFSDLDVKNSGSLDLFSSLKGKPIEIAKSIQPKFNRFTFFEVSETSFHQVREVIGKQRFAIGGWFYGK